MEKTEYITLLRGINVGGHNVPMQKMRELFRELGLTNVRSYIQTGNIFFTTTENDRIAVTEKIEKHLEKALGYKVPTFLRTIAEFEHTIEIAPFKNVQPTADTRHFIMFTSAPLPEDLVLPFISPKKDYELVKMTASEGFVIAHIINGKLGSLDFLEKAFGISTTSRFYHTAQKILAAAQQK